MDNIEICQDCLALVANGEPAHEAGQKGLEAIAAEGYRVALGDDEGSFSMLSCDVCGTELGGSRFEATLVPAEVTA